MTTERITVEEWERIRLLARQAEEEERRKAVAPPPPPPEPPKPPPPPKPPEVPIPDRIAELEKQAQQAEKLAGLQDIGGLSVEEIRYQAEQRPTLLREAESARAKVQILRDYQHAEQLITRIEENLDKYDIKAFTYTDRSGIKLKGQEAWDTYKTEVSEGGANLEVLTSKKLSPFIQINEKGQYTVDVYSALKAGISPATLKSLGVSEKAIADARKPGAKPALSPEEYEKAVAAQHFVYQQTIKRLKKDHVQLPDGQWISNERLAEIKELDPELYDKWTTGGYEAAKDYWDKNYTELPDGMALTNQTLAFIKDMPGRGYEILTTKGYDAYIQYYDDMADRLKPFAVYDRGKLRGYELENALRKYDKEVTEAVEVLFDPASVNKAKSLTNYDNIMRVKEIGYDAYKEEQAQKLKKLKEEIIVPEEQEPQPTSKLAIPAGLAAAGTVALVEPTPFGELAVLVAISIIAASGGYAYKNRRELAGMLAGVSDAVTDFRNRFGRDPKASEIKLVDEAGNMASLETIMDPTKPRLVAKATPGDIMVFSPAPVLDLAPPPFPGTIMEPIKIPATPGAILEKVGVPPSPGTIIEKIGVPPTPGTILEPVKIPPTSLEAPIKSPTMMVSVAVEVAEAEETIEKIIYPNKVMTPAELEALWNRPTAAGETAKALAALDSAVTEAHMRGELTDEEVSDYRAARKRYLARLGALSLAMQTWIGGMMPELKGEPLKEVSMAATAAYLTALRNISSEAAEVAKMAFVEAMQQGKTIEQASTIAQTAALTATETATQTQIQQALKTATQTITRVAPKTAAQEAVKQAVQTAIQQAVQTATPAITNTAIRAAVAEATTTARATTTTAIQRARLRPPEGKMTDEEKRQLIKDAPGAVAWPQGELHGKKVWHTVIEPYSQATHLVVVGKQPEGAKLYPGPREAYKSITQLHGKPPAKPTKVEGGAVDPVISSERGRVKIEFVADKSVRRRGFPKVKTSQSNLASDIVETRRGRRRRRHIRLT